MIMDKYVDEEIAKGEIFSELEAIMKLNDGVFSYKDAYDNFMNDFYNCYHVIDYKKKYADEWLKSKLYYEIN